MSRSHSVIRQSLIAAATLAFAASGAALADDSMSRLTGDSYAYFNGLDHSPGHFNVARAPEAAPMRDPVAKKVPRDELIEDE